MFRTAQPNPLALDAVERPVFVVGTMRSGTGFVGLGLNEASSLVGCPFELRRIWTEIGGIPMASDVVGDVCPEMTARDAERVPRRRLHRAFALEIAKNIGSKPWSANLRFLNKNPHLCNKMELLEQLFPHASYVWTFRGMEDVVCSLKNLFERDGMRARGVQHVWPEAGGGTTRCFGVRRGGVHERCAGDRIFPGGDLVYLAEYWTESNLAMLRAFERLGSEHVCPIAQQDLFDFPERHAARLARFLGLNVEDVGGLPGRIDRTQVAQWRHPLSADDSARLQSFRRDNAASFARIEAVFRGIESAGEADRV